MASVLLIVVDRVVGSSVVDVVVGRSTVELSVVRVTTAELDVDVVSGSEEVVVRVEVVVGDGSDLRTRAGQCGT